MIHAEHAKRMNAEGLEAFRAFLEAALDRIPAGYDRGQFIAKLTIYHGHKFYDLSLPVNADIVASKAAYESVRADLDAAWESGDMREYDHLIEEWQRRALTAA